MTARRRNLVFLMAAVGAAATVVVRHGRGAVTGRRASGGILIGDAGVYDIFSRWLLGPFFRRVASDVAAVLSPGARVLEVGCGPGHLSVRLARDHGLDVTGLDLDPAMIGRARANSRRTDGRGLAFLVGDVSSLPFPDGSFDAVVSTLSMHHWTDPAAALTDIGRVLKPGARALVWDFRPGAGPLHEHLPDPAEQVERSSMRIVGIAPWSWPWRLHLVQRIELVPADEA